jgi:hypothetical protein
MDIITREAGGECARIIGILRGKKAYLEETYHVGSIGIFGSWREPAIRVWHRSPSGEETRRAPEHRRTACTIGI